MSDAESDSEMRGRAHLAGSEGDPVVVLHPLLLLALVQLLPADADGHRAQVFVHTKVVLVLCGGEARPTASRHTMSNALLRQNDLVRVIVQLKCKYIQACFAYRACYLIIDWRYSGIKC